MLSYLRGTQTEFSYGLSKSDFSQLESLLDQKTPLNTGRQTVVDYHIRCKQRLTVLEEAFELFQTKEKIEERVCHSESHHPLPLSIPVGPPQTPIQNQNNYNDNYNY